MGSFPDSRRISWPSWRFSISLSSCAMEAFFRQRDCRGGERRPRTGRRRGDIGFYWLKKSGRKPRPLFFRFLDDLADVRFQILRNYFAVEQAGHLVQFIEVMNCVIAKCRTTTRPRGERLPLLPFESLKAMRRSAGETRKVFR